MQVMMIKSRIQRATVTRSNLDYSGSITIDRDLLDKVSILQYEKVLVLNKSNGKRFETYVIKGDRGSGEICVNGAAARMVQVGDQLTILSFGLYKENEAEGFHPGTILLDKHNRITKTEINTHL